MQKKTSRHCGPRHIYKRRRAINKKVINYKKMNNLGMIGFTNFMYFFKTQF